MGSVDSLAPKEATATVNVPVGLTAGGWVDVVVFVVGGGAVVEVVVLVVVVLLAGGVVVVEVVVALPQAPNSIVNASTSIRRIKASFRISTSLI